MESGVPFRYLEHLREVHRKIFRGLWKQRTSFSWNQEPLPEFSTPFLNLRNIMLQLKQTKTPLFTICTYMFALTFFVLRIFVGIPRSYIFWQDILDLLFYNRMNNLNPKHPIIIVYYMLLANIILNGLNIFWAYKIIQSVTKKRDIEKKKD